MPKYQPSLTGSRPFYLLCSLKILVDSPDLQNKVCVITKCFKVLHDLAQLPSETQNLPPQSLTPLSVILNFRFMNILCAYFSPGIVLILSVPRPPWNTPPLPPHSLVNFTSFRSKLIVSLLPGNLLWACQVTPVRSYGPLSCHTRCLVTACICL